MNIFNKIIKHPIFYGKLFLKHPTKGFEEITKCLFIKKYRVAINKNSFFVKYRPLFWDQVKNGKWEPNTFKIFDKFIDMKHSFVDIGAWIGPMTLYGSRNAKFCYAIEPDPVAFDELNHNVNLNENLKPKIKIYNLCISDKCGEVKFGNKFSFGDSMSSIFSGDSKESLMVKTLTLDEFFKINKIDDCNFIKMDIEGGESIVIPNIKNLLLGKKPTLFLSLHPQFFMNLKKDSERIIKTLKIYRNVFDNRGRPLTFDDLLHKYLLKNAGCEIVVTDKEWDNN